MDRRSYLKYAGSAAAVGLLAGCSGSESGDGNDGSSDGTDGGSSGDGSDGGSDGGTTYGTLATSVTDQPSDIGDFESCIVTIEGMWLKPADSDDGDEDEVEASDESNSATETTTAENDTETETSTEEPTQTATETAEPAESETATTQSTESGESEAESNEESDDDSASSDNGRRYIEFDDPQKADLVKLQGSKTQLIEETDVETGEYLFLQLSVSGVEGTLTDGSEASVETPGNAPLKFNAKFEIRAEERTHFVADFTPVKRGNGSYLIRPVATGTKVLYGDESYEASNTESTSETETEMKEAETETESGESAESSDAGEDGNGSSRGKNNGNN